MCEQFKLAEGFGKRPWYIRVDSIALHPQNMGTIAISSLMIRRCSQSTTVAYHTSMQFENYGDADQPGSNPGLLLDKFDYLHPLLEWS